jgi:hypothetical protein
LRHHLPEVLGMAGDVAALFARYADRYHDQVQG